MNTSNKLTLQSGLLVSLSSSVTGGVSYERKDLAERCGKEGTDAMGAKSTCKLAPGHEPPCNFAALTAEEITRWETTRTIADKAEHEKATKVRNKARSLITGVCVASNFGNLCLASKEAELDQRYIEAKEMVDEFNRQAQFTRVSVYMLKGVIPDSVNSAASMSSEVVTLLDQMIGGIAAGDEETVRKAANDLTQLAEMLGDASKALVEKAIAEARSAARVIVKAKAEEQTGAALATFTAQKKADKAQAATNTLKQARKALDMSGDVFAQIEAAAKKHAG